MSPVRRHSIARQHPGFPPASSSTGVLPAARTLTGPSSVPCAKLVCLAGFMRLLTPDFVGNWRDRVINIHPSLLPAFPGLHTHARTLAAGVKVHGATVHVVTAELDGGPIVAQGAVPVV